MLDRGPWAGLNSSGAPSATPGSSALPFRFGPSVGKGSHGRLHVGGRFTTVPRKELGKGLLGAMLKDLGVDREDF